MNPPYLSVEIHDHMQAVIFRESLRFVQDHPVPSPGTEQARIRVKLAGICRTDLEIIKGYMGFKGILGHEFTGVVESCQDASWVGKRVVGEINAACGSCDYCMTGFGRHCPGRSTLGISGLDGCMAEYCVLPVTNLFCIEKISDEQAVLTEPLAAACEILEQVPLHGDERVVVLGDGRLGTLCAWVLATAAGRVTLVGHHQGKLDLAGWQGIETSLLGQEIEPGADIVVDATGSSRGIEQAIALCRPRGTIVLKSTVAQQGEVNLSPLVVNEITLVGSRCGQFSHALDMMLRFPDMPLERLITHRYPLHQALEAFETAQSGKALKVVLEVHRE